MPLLLLPLLLAADPCPLSEPLALITRAKAAYAKIDDYSCRLIRRERLDGELGPNQVIALTVRVKPFSVAMKWAEPKNLVGQEAVYVAGTLDGKMRVRPAGLLGGIGLVTIAVDDPRVMKTSRHPITEAGIGRLIELFGKGWAEEAAWGKTEVKAGNFTFANRKCRRVELIHATPEGGKFLHHRNVVFFDAETHLPIRIENYDWPAKPGEAGPLLETFSYVNMKVNAGVPEGTFGK